MRRAILLLLVASGVGVGLAWSRASSTVLAQSPSSGAPSHLAGLIEPAEVIRDTYDIAHILASNEHDAVFLQGYTHAEDRLFQMDVFRHLGSGTYAELVGPAALPQDVQMRTLGLRRAAARSLAIQSARMVALLQAYADGVNAWIAAHPLPPEYSALGVSSVVPWEPLDTLTVLKLLALQMNFNRSDLQHTVALASYQKAGAAMGFDGARLFFDDLFRSAPFGSAATIPDAVGDAAAGGSREWKSSVVGAVDSKAARAAIRYLDDLKGLEFFKRLDATQGSGGSNGWVVGGQHTESGAPLMANDPHLAFDYPLIWYPIHLSAGELDVIGNSIAGIPFVILGHNRWISWGATASLADVMDYYQERVVPDPTSPSGLSTLYKGSLEHVVPIPESYRARVNGEVVPMTGNGLPPVTLIVPRRNNGPLVQFDATIGAAISVQWTGSSASRDLEAALAWAAARGPEEFERGVRFFTIPQNLHYIDRRGNFGYYMAGEVPVREDLQSGAVAGLPPGFVRNGQGGNEWLPLAHPQPDQSLPYEILPFDEMPHVLNPAGGWSVNANNDPLGLTFDNNPLARTRPGGGIYFLSGQFHVGIRAARITELLREKMNGGKVSAEDMRGMQADTRMGDAAFFVPFVLRAFERGTGSDAPAALAALTCDGGMAEAVGRLRAWDFTAPTGLAEGFDAGDRIGQLNPRSSRETANSVAATIYATWRSQFAKRVIDAKLVPYGLPTPDSHHQLTALKHLLDVFDDNHGVGASGVDFFAWPEVSCPADRRELYILQALKDALGLLASDAFQSAFGHSTNQADYLWGKLHRLVMAHPLGSAFNVPPAGGLISSSLRGLAGIPVDGGYETVDVGSNVVRGDDENAFVVRAGASQRSIAEALPKGVRGVSSLPGGISGVPGTPRYVNLLPGFLVNDTYDQLLRISELQAAVRSVKKYEP